MAISHKAMQALGWTRIDPKPWSKLHAEWEHETGWRIRHCGHPTAVHPWMLLPPDGVTELDGVEILCVGVCSGVMYEGGNAQTGYAWHDLTQVTNWFAGWLARRAA